MTFPVIKKTKKHNTISLELGHGHTAKGGRERKREREREVERESLLLSQGLEFSRCFTDHWFGSVYLASV